MGYQNLRGGLAGLASTERESLFRQAG